MIDDRRIAMWGDIDLLPASSCKQWLEDLNDGLSCHPLCCLSHEKFGDKAKVNRSGQEPIPGGYSIIHTSLQSNIFHLQFNVYYLPGEITKCIMHTAPGRKMSHDNLELSAHFEGQSIPGRIYDRGLKNKNQEQLEIIGFQISTDLSKS
ncbi:MAG: hypothetical protein KDC80_04900 [Saprospiraceae bacterium]|nr:hypothetical protein [Saprospiraceae bacterium]